MKLPKSPFADFPELVEILRSYSRPLLPAARRAFCEAVDRALVDHEPGLGIHARICRQVQRQFVAAPDAPPAVDGRR